MSDITLFRLAGDKAVELQGQASDLEKPLQTLIERNLDALLGIRFLATEYPTGKTHAGRIDTLGLDENNCPVILEYKRSMGENVINQGLFYLDWLMDHRAEFKLLVLEYLGKASAAAIDWTAPRLVCIAADFTRYDSHAVQQVNHNIELLRYRRFGKDLLLLELVNATVVKSSGGAQGVARASPRGSQVTAASRDKTVAEWLKDLSPRLLDLFESLEGYLMSLGDDVQRKDLRLYVAFKRIKNFATVVFQKDRLLLYLRLDPASVVLEEDFTRDVSKVGHWGTGELQVSVADASDLDRAKGLIRRAYDGGTRAN